MAKKNVEEAEYTVANSPILGEDLVELGVVDHSGKTK